MTSWGDDVYAAYQAGRAARGKRPSVPGEPERIFQARVLELLRTAGYKCYHTRDSRGSQPGFPDLVAVRPGHPIIFAELKTVTGKLTSEQHVWLEHLRRAQGHEVFVWTPRDMQDIIAMMAA